MVEIDCTDLDKHVYRAIRSWSDYPKRVYAYAPGHYKYIKFADQLKLRTIFTAYHPDLIQEELKQYQGHEQIVIICLRQDEANFRKITNLRQDLSINIVVTSNDS